MASSPQSFTDSFEQANRAGIDNTDVEDRRHDRDTFVGRMKDDWRNLTGYAGQLWDEAKDEYQAGIDQKEGRVHVSRSTPRTFSDQEKPPSFIPDAPAFIPDPKPQVAAPVHVTPDVASDIWKAGIHSKMLGVTPGTAYANREYVQQQLGEQSPGYDDPKLDPTIANDIKVGLQSSIFGLQHRHALAEEVNNGSMVDKFITGISQMVADVPFMLAGGILGGAAGSEVPVVGNAVGAGAGAFAIPAAAREALTLGIKNGEVTSMPDLLRRMAKTAWAGTKGAITGAATELAGGIPVGSVVAKSGLGSIAVKGLYQATAMTTTADLLEGRLPTKDEFAGNAAMILPLNLILHGAPMMRGQANEALLDVYAKDGKTPQQSTETLNAQPPVKPDMPPGLTPAINLGEGHIESGEGETHADLAERVLAKKPVSMEQLEADPSKADDVLQNPGIHDQETIERAWQIKSEAVEAGDVEVPEGGEKPLKIEDIYDRNAMKSGRGFTTPDGQFLSRMEARKWMKENEPDVHQAWLDDQGGDKQAELHSEDYGVARMRVQGRTLAEGDPTVDGLDPELKRVLAEARSTGGILNKVKAGMASAKYGYEAIRTLLVGPRDFLRAEGNQVVDSLRKLVPEEVDQQALHFFRDYRGDLPSLQAQIEEIREGDNEALKQYIPAMERAVSWNGALPKNISKADGQMTAYFQKALERGKAAGTLESGVDPSRYSPRMFKQTTEEGVETGGVARPRFTDKTVNSIRRKYLNTLDALKEGDNEARTFNAIDELGVYSDSHAVSVSTALFKTELKNSALGVEGSRDKALAGWVPLTKQFEDRRTIVNEDGSQVTTVKNLYVPKDIADALKPLLRDPGEFTEIAKFLHIQSVIKSVELALSAFHIKALNITAFNNMGFRDFFGSMVSDTHAPETQAIERRGALYGLQTTKTGIPFESYMNIKPEETATGFARLGDNTVVNSVKGVSESISRYTFDTVQRKWKVMDFAKKEAAWVGKNPGATESQYGAAMRSISKEINASYGGLNWDVMGVSKGMQSVMRMALLAPDWTFSNVANLKYAAFDGGPGGTAARMFFAKSFATGIASTAAASIFIGGKYDPTDIKHLDQVYLGTDKDGKEMYANWFFAGAPKDAMNLIKRSYSEGPVAGLAEVILSKASPVAGTLVDIAKNKDYKGAPIYKGGDSDLKKTAETSKYAGEKLLPITGVSAVETVTKDLTDPEHDWSYKDILDLAADAIGSPTYHQGAASSGETGSRESSRSRFERAGSTPRYRIRGWPMKFIVYSQFGEIADLAIHLQKVEGHEVLLCVGEQDCQKIADGILDHITDWYRYLGQGYVWVFDSCSYGDLQDWLREQGEAVFGGCTGGDALENDRQAGQEWFKSAGFHEAHSENFTDFDAAIEFITNNEGTRYILKQNGSAPKSLSHMGKFESGVDMLYHLDHLKKSWNVSQYGPIDFDLMEVVEGLEVAASAFFNGTDWMRQEGKVVGYLNFEEKKEANGGTGETTGEMGTTFWGCTEDNELFRDIICPPQIAAKLKEIGFRGVFDINCIVTDEGQIVALEPTCRFGVPATSYEFCEGLESGAGALLEAVAKGQNTPVKVHEGWGMVMVVAAKPFPITSHDEQHTSIDERLWVLKDGEPADDFTAEQWKHIHLYNFLKDDDGYKVATKEGYMLTVTATGEDIKSIRGGLIEYVKDNISLPGMKYRTDLGERVEEYEGRFKDERKDDDDTA